MGWFWVQLWGPSSHRLLPPAPVLAAACFVQPARLLEEFIISRLALSSPCVNINLVGVCCFKLDWNTQFVGGNRPISAQRGWFCSVSDVADRSEPQQLTGCRWGRLLEWVRGADGRAEQTQGTGSIVPGWSTKVLAGRPKSSGVLRAPWFLCTEAKAGLN